MSPNQIVDTAETKIQNAVTHFQDELKKLRTGRAHAGMLDGVMVEAYGTSMPLIQVGSVSAPEPQLLQISPFDPNNIAAITSAIRDNKSLGFNPMDDGRVVRIPIPPLTEERRHEITKLVGTKLEDCMIAMRNARHEALKEADAAKKDKALGEDDYSRLQKQIDEEMARRKSEVEGLAKAKEQEILTV